MKTSQKLFSLFIAVLMLAGASFAQEESGSKSLQETLTNLAGKTASAYLKPIGSGFGANLNTGWVTRSPKAEIWGIDIQFGFVAMGAVMAEDAKSFSYAGDFRFDINQAKQMTSNVNTGFAAGSAQDQAIKNGLAQQISQQDFTVSMAGPTVVGKKDDHIKVHFNRSDVSYNGHAYAVPEQEIDLGVGGLLEEIPLLPLAAPQLTVGTLYGTQVAFRYLPSVKINDELGETKYFGFGIQHNVGQWIPVPLPVNLSVGYFTQNLKVGTILESSATEFGLYASRTFGPGALNITPYAGFSLQSSSMKVTYDYEFETQAGTQKSQISFDLDGENSSKFMVGLALKLAFLNVNVDYNMAKYSTVGAGVGFIF